MKFSFESGHNPAPSGEEVLAEEAAEVVDSAGHPEETEAENDTERIQTREEIFRDYINAGIYEDFFEALEDAEFDDEQLDEFQAALKDLDKDELAGVFSLPYELRGMRLARVKADIEAGKVTPREAIRQLADSAAEHGFTIGYHVSPNQISKVRENGKQHWGVRGYEMDDRDNRPMAYYALDYENIYRKRPGTKYLYTIRAQTGPNSDHKVDTSNNWGRATGLSIIKEFDLKELEEDVQRDYERQVRARDEQRQHVEEESQE